LYSITNPSEKYNALDESTPITSLEDVFFQDFSLGDNTSLMPKIYPNSQVFTIMICL
jgi:hypothetical protein